MSSNKDSKFNLGWLRRCQRWVPSCPSRRQDPDRDVQGRPRERLHRRRQVRGWSRVRRRSSPGIRSCPCTSLRPSSRLRSSSRSCLCSRPSSSSRSGSSIRSRSSLPSGSDLRLKVCHRELPYHSTTQQPLTPEHNLIYYSKSECSKRGTCLLACPLTNKSILRHYKVTICDFILNFTK